MARRRVALAVAVAWLLVGHNARGQTPYYVTNLGTIPGYNVFGGMAISANGQVAVEATPRRPGNLEHAYLYNQGSLTDLGLAPGFRKATPPASIPAGRWWAKSSTPTSA